MFGASESGAYTATARKLQPSMQGHGEPVAELAPEDLDRRHRILDELKAIVTSILTGRINPVTLSIVSRRYADVKGFTIPFRRLGCASLAEVFQKHFADEMACSYMHYYKDFVVWMKDDNLSRDTVIHRLKRYTLCVHHNPSVQHGSSVRKTPFKRPPNNVRTLSSGRSAHAVTSSILVPKRTPPSSRIALEGLQARSGVGKPESPTRTPDPAGQSTKPAGRGQSMTMVRTTKRGLSSDTSLILPVQRMRITDIDDNADPKGSVNLGAGSSGSSTTGSHMSMEVEIDQERGH